MSKITIVPKDNTFTLPTGETFKLSDMGLKRKPKEVDADFVKRVAVALAANLDNMELPVSKGKVTTIIKCTEKDCPLYRKIYTSDKHQVKFCRDHQKKARSRQTVAYRKAARAAAPKPAAAKAPAKKAAAKKPAAKKSDKK